MNVSDVKENFRDVYGLSIEIFHKRKKWIKETPVSDNMTLDEINKQ